MIEALRLRFDDSGVKGMRISVIVASLFLINLVSACGEDAESASPERDEGRSEVNEEAPAGEGEDEEEVRVLEDGECLSDGDCEGQQLCFLPGVRGCGVESDFDFPTPESCRDDAECAAEGDGLVCDINRGPFDCRGSKPARSCVEQCVSDDDCPEVTFCDDSGHCQPRPPCTSEEECDGFCVQEICLEVPGSCRSPAE